MCSLPEVVPVREVEAVAAVGRVVSAWVVLLVRVDSDTVSEGPGVARDSYSHTAQPGLFVRDESWRRDPRTGVCVGRVHLAQAGCRDTRPSGRSLYHLLRSVEGNSMLNGATITVFSESMTKSKGSYPPHPKRKGAELHRGGSRGSRGPRRVKTVAVNGSWVDNRVV